MSIKVVDSSKSSAFGNAIGEVAFERLRMPMFMLTEYGQYTA